MDSHNTENESCFMCKEKAVEICSNCSSGTGFCGTMHKRIHRKEVSKI